MGRTRQFGNLKYRPNRSNPTRIVASFQTPREAFDKWPGLAERQSKSFPTSAEDDARAWLNDARKRIEAGVWEPTRVTRHRDLSARMTRATTSPSGRRTGPSRAARLRPAPDTG